MNRHPTPSFLLVVALVVLSTATALAGPSGSGHGSLQAHRYGVDFAGFGVDNPPDVTGVQLGLHAMTRNLRGMQFGIGSSAGHAAGFQLGLASAMTSDRLAGLQLALAVAESEKGMDGFQFAFFRTSAGNHIAKDRHGNRIEPARKTTSSGIQLVFCGAYAEELDGIQLAVWDAHAQDLDGVQIGAIHTAERFSGLQIGLWNVAGVEGKGGGGLQLGLVNTSDDFTGLQMGLINHAKSLHGIQIGLVNFCDSSSMSVLPVVNGSF